MVWAICRKAKGEFYRSRIESHFTNPVFFRYCNVDYVLGAAWHLLPTCIRRVLSYDIACQWRVNLPSRIAQLPDHVRFELPVGNDLRYAIPKFHFRAHKHEDHDEYSLNLMPGVGRVDGEETERHWSRNNMIAYSTREMGPGSRHDTVEDHIGFANWMKYIGLGKVSNLIRIHGI